MKHEPIYLVTDGCMWEINQETNNEHPHAMEVVDTTTGAVRFIKSGSHIRFLSGDLIDLRSTTQTQKSEAKKVSANRKDDVQPSAGRKRASKAHAHAKSAHS